MHTEKEQADALNLASGAYERGLDLFQAGDSLGLSTDIGYIKAISDLAASEGHDSVARITLRQALRLEERLKELLTRKGPQLGGKPSWLNQTYGRKPKQLYETIEEKEQRERRVHTSQSYFFQEETADEGAPLPPLFFQHAPTNPELIATYVHVPESPEMTLSDIYDVIYCKGQWNRLRTEGQPCLNQKEEIASPEDVVRATQFLLSQGFRPMQD